MPCSGSFNFFMWVRKRLPFAAKQNPLGEPSRQPSTPVSERQAVERIVQLDRVEMLRVELQHLRSGQLFRVKGTAPVFVVPAGCADVNGCASRHADAISSSTRRCLGRGIGRARDLPSDHQVVGAIANRLRRAWPRASDRPSQLPAERTPGVTRILSGTRDPPDRRDFERRADNSIDSGCPPPAGSASPPGPTPRRNSRAIRDPRGPKLVRTLTASSLRPVPPLPSTAARITEVTAWTVRKAAPECARSRPRRASRSPECRRASGRGIPACPGPSSSCTIGIPAAAYSSMPTL